MSSQKSVPRQEDEIFLGETLRRKKAAIAKMSAFRCLNPKAANALFFCNEWQQTDEPGSQNRSADGSLVQS
jgi:hypothetical protein